MNETLQSGPGFTSIVVPTDGSDLAERAIAPALTLARGSGVPVLFVRVEVDPAAMEATGREVDELAERHAGDVKIETAVVPPFDDDVARALVAEAADRQALICMASHGRTRVGKAVLGSVAADVVGRSPDAVLLIGPECNPERELTGQRLGVCLDGSKFAEAILPVAARWASTFGLRLWLLESASPADLADLAGAPSADVVESSYVARIARGLSARGLPGETNWDVLHARQPVDAIVTYAEEHPVGVLAMATHGRRGWARLAEGSVALQVLHRSPCPVLLVHPAEEAEDDAGG
jgi:nucleotide-binding universal stress UspA family protein